MRIPRLFRSITGSRPWSVRSDPIYELIGMITVSWALIECSVDNMCLTISSAEEIQDFKAIPVNFSGNIEFLRRSLKAQPRLQTIKEEGMGLLREINIQVEARHNFIHGTASIPTRSGNRIFARVINGTEAKKEIRFHYSHDRGWKIHSDALKLSRRTSDFSQRLISEIEN